MVMWVAGKNYDPVNTCHSVVLHDSLGRKNALYKYLILYFYFYFTPESCCKISARLNRSGI